MNNNKEQPDWSDVVCHRALETFGPQAQTIKCFEEMSELQKELCKNTFGADNKDQIAEEIADVLITLQQMILHHDCDEAVFEWREKKLKRLAKKVDEYAADRRCPYRDGIGLCKLMSGPYGQTPCENPESCELLGRV